MNRLEQLDSIRGIAALFVFFNHVLLMFPIMFSEQYGVGVTILKDTPIHLLWGGHEAVLIFFILSGYVLSLSFLSRKAVTYTTYLKKRIVRLYIPFVVALMFAIVMNSLLFNSNNLTGTSEWINHQWSEYKWTDILWHVLFIGEFDTHVFNGPVWSLVHEMRVSIIFPVLMVCILKLSWFKNLLIMGTFSVIGFLLSKLTGSSNIDYFITLHYAAIFMAGALLAKHQNDISKNFKKLHEWQVNLMIVCSILLLTYNYWFLPSLNLIHVEILSDWIATVGAAIWIVLAVSSAKVTRFLLQRPLMFVGKISYSFYLYHFIVILSMMYAFNGKLPLWSIGLISLAITLILSSIMYRIVEMPSIQLTKKIGKSNDVATKLRNQKEVS